MVCKKCGNELMKEGSFCPNCGTNNEQKNKKFSSWNFIIIVILSLIIVGGISFLIYNHFNNTDDYDNSIDDNTSINYDNTENEQNEYIEEPLQEEQELSESDKIKLKVVSLIDKGLVFDAGDYIKGDIPAGEYAFIKFGSSSYYEEEDAAGNIIDNENFDSFGYVRVLAAGNIETKGILVSTKAFKELGVTGAKQLYEIMNDTQNYNQSGYYKVGVDIKAGTYVVESLGGSGYYAIQSGPVGKSDIIKNDNFNGKKVITVKNGQYVEISRATITEK